jgi:HPt (histidine-containing phosphotransfer) domain-containing protein
MSSSGGAGRVDFGVLDRLAAGDQVLMREVLEIFLSESDRWADGLSDGEGQSLADVVHTLMGSGRAVGAHDLVDLCESWEMGEIDHAGPILEELAKVTVEIRDWLAR